MTISELYERGKEDEDEAYYVRHIEASELQACPVCGTKSHVHNDAPYGGYFCFRCNVSWQTVSSRKFKPSEALLRAAEIADDRNHGGCDAIWVAVNWNGAKSLRCFNHFEVVGSGRERGSYWWGIPRYASEQQHNARVLGLLFAAEMAKSAGE